VAPPYTFQNPLRVYDRMVANWIGSLPVDYGRISGRSQSQRGLLWVYSSPTKALASMSQILVEKGWVRPGNVGAAGKDYDDWVNVPLPFASIQRQDPEFDPERARIPFVYRKFARNGKRYISSRFPLPFDITYNVEYWMRRKFTDAHIREWLMVQHSPIGASPNELFLNAEFGLPWGTKMIPLQNLSYSDNSDLEPDEESDRRLRFSLTFTLKAWIFPPAMEPGVPMVLRVITDYGPESHKYKGEFESVYDRHIYDPKDNVEHVLAEDPILFNTSTDVVQNENTFTMPNGGYIESVDIPLLQDQAAIVEAKIVTDPPVPLTIQVYDYNGLEVQGFRAPTPNTDINFLTLPEASQGGLRFRITPASATAMTVNDLVTRTSTLDFEEADDLFPAGQTDQGVPADWAPLPTHTTTAPDVLAFAATPNYNGTRSLHVETSVENQGIERVIPVPERSKLWLVRLRLYVEAGTLEWTVLDDVEGSHAIEHLAVIRPVERWCEYALAVRSKWDGPISMRLRQRGNAGSTFYVDSVSLYRVVVHDDMQVLKP
jgi:hypothetical protein